MTSPPTLLSDALWYKDAVIYQVHVKTFFDANDDGYGDFPGLIKKLDYIQELGVNCLWLLPFYPSPLRDDGYDIADYRGIHPIYGDRKDFRSFIKEAHRRGLRVITELVVNHTSDQHPWFMASRQAPSGSVKRNYYVWSKTNQRYADARIIFTDTEESNWTWDPVAKAYYWHRFFSHQPDLNFDNPHVRKAVVRIMRFWLDLGVDGLRLDAVPYLVEREGTNCENLPETHSVLKEWRQVVDQHYEDRILLAEANQWPTDVVHYFGQGDECHMAFHFPLMPRVFMALHQEDRHPVSEILRQTPDIPANCQWAIFLRNHDELTLEMVTDVERDYMYRAYAEDPQMRINLGIRRRLAPLLQFSRPRIELLNSLLFSLPGTPIIYYGDEIGMGENIFLGDRNSVRTPMQWNSDRNGGFSRALFAKLYSPPNMDPVTGYQSINVEQQSMDPSSLLHWMRTIIRMRNQHKVFGRGTIQFLHPDNRKILAFLRSYQDETVLVVANLSRYPQAAELDLSAFEGIVPIEMFGLGEFPRIGENKYTLTIGGHSFFWFLLQPVCDIVHMPVPAPTNVREEVSIPSVTEARTEAPVFAVDFSERWQSLLAGSFRHTLESDLLPKFVKGQPWFAGSTDSIKHTEIIDQIDIPDRGGSNSMLLVRIDGGLYQIFLAVAGGDTAEELVRSSPESVLARLSTTSDDNLVLFDASAHSKSCLSLLMFMESGNYLSTSSGRLQATTISPHQQLIASEEEVVPVRRAAAERSNLSLVYGNRFILKLIRHFHAGSNPDYEIGRFLAKKGKFKHTPRVIGALEYRPANSTEQFTLGVLREFVPNQGDAWTYTVEELRRFYERAAAHMYLLEHLDIDHFWLSELVDQSIPQEVQGLLGIYFRETALLGTRTAELHLALAEEGRDPAFKVEAFTKADLMKISLSIGENTRRLLESLPGKADQMQEELRKPVRQLCRLRGKMLQVPQALADVKTDIPKMRCHGDFHLGQILRVSGDFFVRDFEGDPGVPPDERPQKHTPIKDVAAMLRSFSYATFASLLVFARSKSEDLERFLPWARVCQSWVMAAFLKAYLAAAGGRSILPADRADFFRILEALMLEKAVVELNYELNNRPDWFKVPLYSILGYLKG